MATQAGCAARRGYGARPENRAKPFRVESLCRKYRSYSRVRAAIGRYGLTHRIPDLQDSLIHSNMRASIRH